MYSVLMDRIVELPGCGANSSIQDIAPKIYRILLSASIHNNGKTAIHVETIAQKLMHAAIGSNLTIQAALPDTG